MSFRIIFFALIFLAGCGEKALEVPAGIIPRDSMVNIMADVHIAEARMVVAGSKGLQRDIKSAYMLQVLSKSGVDTSRFVKSFDFYSAHPEFFYQMYEEVVVEISQRQAKRE